MNRIRYESPICISWRVWYYGVSDLQPGHVNPGSLESGLVSEKMKKGVIYTIIVFTIMITYNTSLDNGGTT